MIQNDVDLSKMTTFKIGGKAINLYTPESIEELYDVLNIIDENRYYIISAGSNLLINDKKEFEHVISIKELDKRIIDRKNGRFYLGTSVRIQSAIKETNRLGYGGLEEFYSIPALIGGMIFMNAGVGRKKNDAIGDYIISVDVLENGVTRTYLREECKFKYRQSVFQEKSKIIILGATVQLYPISKDDAEKRIKNRIEYANRTQDHSGASFGTLCSQSNTRLIALSRALHKGNPKGVHFSTIRPNCLINNGEGTFEESMKLIRSVQRLHKFFHKKCELEVRIWS